MTTIVGIRTNVGEEAVVLGSDTQLNYFDDDDKPIAKKPLLKIVYGDFWALAHCGADTNALRSFYNRLKNPDDKRYRKFNKDKLLQMINKSVDSKRFLEVDELNANYVRDGGDYEEAHEFLFALNEPGVDLFHIDLFGNLKNPENDSVYIVLGSGHEDAEKYLEDQIEGETYDSSNIDLASGIKLCRSALKKAGSDFFSGLPIDLAVIKRNKIHVYGKKIKEALELAEEKVLEEIIDELERI